MLTLMTNPKPEASLASQFKDLWSKAKRPLAFLLLLLIVLHNYVHVPVVQSGAIWALGYILLSQLFQLVDLATAKRKRRSFESIADAEGAVLEYIKECDKRDSYVEIEWLGMTMFNVWGILTFTLNKLLEEGVVRNLCLKVSMLDPPWLLANQINVAWTQERARATCASIVAYFDEIKVRYPSGLNWSCEINFYSHMPGIHGGLINGKYLVLGICQWSRRNLHAGDCPYYLYTFNELDDLDKIKIFKGWFDYCSRQSNKDNN